MKGVNQFTPPGSFPRIQGQVNTARLTRETPSCEIGPVLEPEGIALKVLADEGTALVQAFGHTLAQTMKLQKAVGGSGSDFSEGFADFADTVAIAAYARELIEHRFVVPIEHKTFGNLLDENVLAKFRGPIEQDNMVLGEHVAGAIVAAVQGMAKEHTRGVNWGHQTPQEVEKRITSRKRGAEHARDLYLEALKLAQKVLPNRLKLK